MRLGALRECARNALSGLRSRRSVEAHPRNGADRRREELAFQRDQFSRGTLTCHRGVEDNMTMDTPLRVEIERLVVKMRFRQVGQVRELRLVANGRGFILVGHART
jgi:hypothetical protein